jgi:hypothetical protein
VNKADIPETFPHPMPPATVNAPDVVPALGVASVMLTMPLEVNPVTVPMLVICDCTALTLKVVPVFVNPDPAPTMVESTYALFATCSATVGETGVLIAPAA